MVLAFAAIVGLALAAALMLTRTRSPTHALTGSPDGDVSGSAGEPASEVTVSRLAMPRATGGSEEANLLAPIAA